MTLKKLKQMEGESKTPGPLTNRSYKTGKTRSFISKKKQSLIREDEKPSSIEILQQPPEEKIVIQDQLEDQLQNTNQDELLEASIDPQPIITEEEDVLPESPDVE